jgi:organic hydroperoxide reductase OsmC/OhrA
MSVVKTHRFPASVHWREGRLTQAKAPGKPTLEVSTPPEFKGGVEGLWSPEELLVASVASCLAVTLAAVAEASHIGLTSIEVDGLGHVERSPEGRFEFTAIQLTLEVGAEGDHPHTLQRLVEDAERRCIVSSALDVPMEVRLVQASAISEALGG